MTRGVKSVKTKASLYSPQQKALRLRSGFSAVAKSVAPIRRTACSSKGRWVMSREGTLGRLPLALYHLSSDRLSEASEIVTLLGGKDGPAWAAHLRRIREAGLPAAPGVVVEKPTSEPITICLGEFVVNYDETIAQKAEAATRTDGAAPPYIDWVNSFVVTDENFPDPRAGEKKFKAYAVCFGAEMPGEGENGLKAWCDKNKKILAMPKEGIDLAKAKLAWPKRMMPLMLPGQSALNHEGRYDTLCFRVPGGRLHLDFISRPSPQGLPENSRILVLEEISLES